MADDGRMDGETDARRSVDEYSSPLLVANDEEVSSGRLDCVSCVLVFSSASESLSPDDENDGDDDETDGARLREDEQERRIE